MHKYERKKDKSKTQRGIIGIMILLALILMGGCLWMMLNAQSNKDSTESTAQQMSSPQDDAPIENRETAHMETQSTTPEDDKDYIVIDTIYADLYYPKGWEDRLNVEMKQQDVFVTVTFNGMFADTQVPLFAIVFGGAEGFPVGIYQTDAGYELDVTAVYYSLDPDEQWTENDLNKAYDMQEQFDYVLSNLAQQPGFTPVS